MEETFEHGGQRDLNSGGDKRAGLVSTRNTNDDVLNPPFDLVRQFFRSRYNLRLGRPDELLPFRLGPLPKHLGRGIDKR